MSFINSEGPGVVEGWEEGVAFVIGVNFGGVDFAGVGEGLFINGGAAGN